MIQQGASMSKSILKNPFVIILLLIVFVAAGWFSLSKTTSHMAEEELQQWLVENELDDKVSWTEFEASPTGLAKLKELRIQDGEQALLFTAEEFHLKGYKESADTFELDFELTQLVDVTENFFQNHLSRYFDSAEFDVPKAIDFSWQMRLDNQSESAFFNPVFKLPEFMHLGLELNTDSPEIHKEFGELLGAGENFKENGIFNLIPLAGHMQLNRLVVTIEDKGGMAQLQHSLKQSAVPGDSSPEIEQQRSEFWERRLAHSKMSCFHDRSFGLVIRDQQKACERLIDFMSGNSKVIRLKITATKPIRLEEAMLAGMMGLSAEMLLAKYEAKVEIE